MAMPSMDVSMEFEICEISLIFSSFKNIIISDINNIFKMCADVRTHGHTHVRTHTGTRTHVKTVL